MNTEYPSCSTVDLLASIEKLQARQKQEPPSSAEWHELDECLIPMFAEIAKRTTDKGLEQ